MKNAVTNHPSYTYSNISTNLANILFSCCVVSFHFRIRIRIQLYNVERCIIWHLMCTYEFDDINNSNTLQSTKKIYNSNKVIVNYNKNVKPTYPFVSSASRNTTKPPADKAIVVYCVNGALLNNKNEKKMCKKCLWNIGTIFTVNQNCSRLMTTSAFYVMLTIYSISALFKTRGVTIINTPTSSVIFYFFHFFSFRTLRCHLTL